MDSSPPLSRNNSASSVRDDVAEDASTSTSNTSENISGTQSTNPPRVSAKQETNALSQDAVKERAISKNTSASPRLRKSEKSESTRNSRCEAYSSSSSSSKRYSSSRDIKAGFSQEIKVANGLNATTTRWTEFSEAVNNGALKFNYLSSEKAQNLAAWLATSPEGLVTLELYSHEIDDNVVALLAEALKTNTRITTLDLFQIYIGNEAAMALAKTLKINKTITTLKLVQNNLHAKGAKSIAEALKFNTTIKNLGLGLNNIGADGVKAIAEALKTNTTITTLDHRGNSIGADGVKALAEALKTNTTITTLDLGGNKIGADGVKALAEALKINRTITRLYLGSNNIGADGAKALAEALKTNTSITRLSLSDNNIGADGAKALAEALKSNTTITMLYLSDNNIGADGAKALAEALKTNTTITTFSLELGDGPTAHTIEFQLKANHNPNGNEMLCKAITLGLIDQVKTILAVGGIDRNKATSMDSTALETAIECADPEMVKLLLELGKVNPNKAGQPGAKSLLVQAVTQSKSPEIIATLVAHGADIHAAGSTHLQQIITRVAGEFYIEVLTAPTTFLQDPANQALNAKQVREFALIKQKALSLLEKLRTAPDDTFSNCFAAITFASIASFESLEEHAYLDNATNINKRFALDKQKNACDAILAKVKKWDGTLDGAGAGSFSILQTASGRLPKMTRELTARLGQST